MTVFPRHLLQSTFTLTHTRLPLALSFNPTFNTDALIKDINTDKLVALHSSSRPSYATFSSDPFFSKPSTLPPPENDPTAVRVKPGEKVEEGVKGVKIDGEKE